MGKKRKSGGFRGGKGSYPDFAKKKVKVGKTLAKANSTNTSFRSRAINVAVQRPVENGAGSTEGGGGGATPTNERGLNFQDLLARCGHYQPNTRKDALQGLRSLFSMNTGYVRLRLGYISKEGRGGEKRNLTCTGYEDDCIVEHSFLLTASFELRLVRDSICARI